MSTDDKMALAVIYGREVLGLKIWTWYWGELGSEFDAGKSEVVFQVTSTFLT